MSDLMRLIQEADIAAVDFERTKQAYENARIGLEKAKTIMDDAQTALNQVLARGDEVGIPRSKMKKLIEERTAALILSGLIPSGEDARPAKAKPARKKAEAAPAEDNAPKVEESREEILAEEERKFDAETA